MRFSSPLFFLGAGLLAVACSSSTDADAPTTTTTTLDGGTGCKSGAECATGLCNAANGQCLPATAGDGKKNGTETDVDCGGPSAPKCANSKACASPDDCTSDVCTGNVCIAPATDSDGIQNGTETDVDCGGPTAKHCDTGGKCASAGDCTSKHCDTGATNKCLAPTFTDTIQNGTETDVDCGGTVGHECAAGLACLVGSDCASTGCNYDKKCAPKASCTPQHGGDTCKSGDGNATESCCTQVTVPGSTFTGASFTVDKYVTTAGRMRTFLAAINGDVRGYMTKNPPIWWKSDWTPWLPTSFDGKDANGNISTTTVQGWTRNTTATDYVNLPDGSWGNVAYATNPTATDRGVAFRTKGAAHDLVVRHVNLASTWAQVAGGILYDQGSQGCYIGDDAHASYGHPTYLVPQANASAIYGDNYTRWISQDALDDRPINCTNLAVLAALCAYDGGMPMNEKQYAYIYDDDGALNGNGTALSPSRSMYPWGTPPTFTCTTVSGVTTCAPPAGSTYDAVNMPHAGGYATVKGEFTQVGPGGQFGFTSNVCPLCDDSWVNWQFNYQDTTWDPYSNEFTTAQQNTRARDQSYFISVPGQFPKGASRAFGGQRVQDIAGLMFESVLPSSGTYSNAALQVTFGDEDATNDIAVNVPAMSLYGGSFEGHQVGAGASFRLPTKYGKMTTRCAYPVK